MFCLDLETLGVESTSAILSLGMTYFDPSKPLSMRQLFKDSIFIKFDVQEQIRMYNRTREKSTLDWWSKQCDYAKRTNLLPSDKDVGTAEGVQRLRDWFNAKPNAKDEMVWVRGHLDQPVFESLLRAMGEPPFISYAAFRDVRTAIDCFYPTSRNGYVEIDLDKCPDYDRDQIVKHHPVADCVLDVCQLFAGK
jgi:hypothetical protein